MKFPVLISKWLVRTSNIDYYLRTSKIIEFLRQREINYGSCQVENPFDGWHEKPCVTHDVIPDSVYRRYLKVLLAKFVATGQWRIDENQSFIWNIFCCLYRTAEWRTFHTQLIHVIHRVIPAIPKTSTADVLIKNRQLLKLFTHRSKFQ